MSSPAIEAFLIDDANEMKFNAHGLSVRQVISVLENRHVIISNRKHRRGIFLIIGKDNGGACIAIPIERTYDKTIWRPITAWYCKDNEKTILKNQEGKT